MVERKFKGCTFKPPGEDSCRRGNCKYFEDCPGGESRLKPDEELIIPKMDSPAGLEGHPDRRRQ